MDKKLLVVCFIILLSANLAYAVKNPFKEIKNPFERDNDTRAEEIKYQYSVLKEDEYKKMNKEILNRTPSGYMTVDEYEALSEYKDKSTIEYQAPPGIEIPSDFKYIPQPLYSIVKYNNPPGSVELSLGKRLFIKRQINAQGIVSPDYSMLIYPAVYYYADSASVACDLFVIPLKEADNNVNRILKANVAQRIPTPILSTDKAIDNFATFRTLTPVDFSEDGKKLLVKEKIGSSEDGIWQTKIYIYDFEKKLSYELSDVRAAVVYYWQEYMDVKLSDNRWDIIPLGFDKYNPDRVIVQGYAYTGKTPIYLGSWSIDCYGEQSRLVSLKRELTPIVSINGYKIIQDGIESYQAVQNQEEFNKKQSEWMQKQYKQADKDKVKEIKERYKYTIKELDDDCKDDLRDYKKLRSLSGSTEGNELEEAYNEYLQKQWEKDIQKTEEEINKQNKKLEKFDNKIKKLNGESLEEIENPKEFEIKQEIIDESEDNFTENNISQNL